MSAVFFLAVLAQAAPPGERPQEEQIVVVGRRLRDWRGRFRTKYGQFHCVTSRLTGDGDIDAIGCTATEICYRSHEPDVIAVAYGTAPRSTRRAARKAVMNDLNNCHRAERDRLVDALIERRSEAR